MEARPPPDLALHMPGHGATGPGEAGADAGRRVEAMRGEAKGHKRGGEPGVSVVVVQRATQTNEEATDCHVRTLSYSLNTHPEHSLTKSNAFERTIDREKMISYNP